MKTISFYRYAQIANPENLRDTLKKSGEEKKILGRILLGREGINGAVSGRKEEIELFQEELQQKFKGLTFREQDVSENSYHKLVVRVRKEICVFGKEIDVKNTGKHLPAKELERWYDEGKKFTIVDARNDYEFDVGHFKDAVKLPIKSFREFPEVAPKILAEKKKETLVLYCTGGVRCEKASAYLKEQGFSDVYQVDGGIISYLNQFSTHWEGGLFVFDDRLVEESCSPLNSCRFCHAKTDAIHNCFNLDCDKLFIACVDCLKKMNRTCSEGCKGSPRQRRVEEKKEIVGKVVNYYPNVKIAAVQFERDISDQETITFKGKTTYFSQKIGKKKVDEEGVATFFVKEKVRKNDKILVPLERIS